ncbi:ion transporter [Hymenobacter sp. HDW8]|uniref:ion transporter n=1 Tax=Hymenobacter sp. HDW8 TaxID=2714932 RepID=UPI00140D30A0|nr:ion transporter [Hymenobacter sp. HDW8]QIL78137.1 ion transporter [Hymenobacter sp. HDW8]QIL78307.1 ion transporter [Hymenobacter sp. HDW8]
MSHSRAYVYQLFDAQDGGRGLERVFDGVILGLVLLNGAAVVLGSVKSLSTAYRPFFVGLEIVSVYAFTIEYGLRVWSSVEDRRFRDPVRGRLRFMCTPMALIDLLAILPFYLSLAGVDLRILRLLRLFRLLKVARYVRALDVIGQVVRRKRPELLVTTGLIGLLLVLVSSLMYYVESAAQPDKFGSIPETMWWGVATLTTVGYGDVYPITVAGKVLSSVIAVLGLGLFALPTGILAAGFSEQLAQQHRSAETLPYCPHCGHKL